jgi:hypothetical protein
MTGATFVFCRFCGRSAFIYLVIVFGLFAFICDRTFVEHVAGITPGIGG